MERLEIRITETLKERFQLQIDKGGFGQSALLRKLIEDWTTKQEEETK